MAPKKLTDCPENLRESIDWLIQVRHGNGAGGKGLEDLAKALKKFVGDAIKNATNSLEKRKEQLECPPKYWKPDSHCKKLETKIEEAKKDAESAENSEKSKKESELDKLKKEKDDHYNDVHYLTDDARDKALKDIQDRQTKLSELKKGLEIFTENNDDCKNLLTRLTEGLEKFLGFDPSSKGYDGSGIVYSDLDRLCDGVMAFLHGVLSGVKDDDAVKTYDKNVAEPKLDSVLNSLEVSIGKGSGVFGSQVGKVSEWLGKYEREVNKKCENVTKNINDLLIANIDNKMGEINNAKSGGCQAIHEAFKASVTDIGENMWTVKNNTEGYKSLDSALKSMLECPMGKIESSIDVLKKSAGNEFLAAQAKKVDDALLEQEREVMKKIEDESKVCQQKIHKEFEAIRNGIRGMKEASKMHFEHIGNALSAAQKFLETEYDSEYKEGILDKFEYIQHNVNASYNNLCRNKDELESLVQKAQGHFAAIKGKVGGAGLQDTIYGGWMTLKAQVGKLAKDIHDKNGAGDNYLGSIITNIGKYADEFKVAEGQDTKTLGNIVQEWVEEIAKVDPVRGDISEYAKANRENSLSPEYAKEEPNDSGIYPQLNKIVATKIQEKLLTGVIDKAVQAAGIVTTNGTIQQYVKAVQLGCNKFSELLADRIKGAKLETLTSAIVQEIHKNGNGGVLSSDASLANNTNLTRAVRFVLNELVGVANGATTELQRFLHKVELSTKLDHAIRSATQIHEQLEGPGETNYGPNITAALGEVTQQITHLHKYLEDKDGNVSIFKKLTTIQEKVIDKLENLRNEKGSKGVDGEINKRRDETANLMEEVKGKMSYRIDLIRNETNAADRGFGMSIDALFKVVDDSRIDAHKSVEFLKTALLQKVQQAFHQLTTEVRTLFSAQKVSDLKALQEVVGEQKKEMQKIMDEDKITGVKGMLHKLKENETTLGSLKTLVDPTRRDNFTRMASGLKELLDSLLQYIESQARTLTERKGTEENPQSKAVNTIKAKAGVLLNYLKYVPPNGGNKLYTFDHNSVELLEQLKKSVTNLTSPNFHGFHNPLLLDALRRGMDKFAEQLGHAYVNKYSGQKRADDWVETKQSADKKTTETQLTPEGRNCAKVCLTILEILNSELKGLRRRWNGLGKAFQPLGYDVATSPTSQDGELRNNADRKGQYIYANLLVNEHNASQASNKFQLVSDNDDNKDNKEKHSVTRKLHTHLGTYYYVSHHYIPPKPRAPGSVKEMLQWLLGLYFNPMRDLLYTYMKELFEKPKGQEAKPYKDISDTDLILDATTKITPTTLKDTLRDVCLYSEDVLVAFQGHGHEGGIYACDFYTNTNNLLYPNSPDACLDMLVDILFRVFHQVRFVYKQCNNGPKSGGWEDCHYGRHVGGSHWQCNDKQCPKQDCEQKHNQMADQHTNCGVKSPLQSFLEDGLPGFLPHTFKTPGCKLTCSLTKHSGIPCITPMGFADIGVAASHTKNGKHLRVELYKLCGDASKPLSKMCSMLNCLLRRTPQTLGDMFGFYYNFIYEWNDNKDKERSRHKKTAFETAVQNANFKDSGTTLEITSMFSSSSHSNHTSNNIPKGDLFSLVQCNKGKHIPALPCGAYMQSSNVEIFGTFSEKRAGNYLSWVTYITESFLWLLYDLYESCKKCDKPGTRCCDRSCDEKCNVKYTDANGNSAIPSTDERHTTDCSSIVMCPTMHPNLYKYGLSFASPYDLSGVADIRTRRTCKDLCRALEKVTGENCVLVQILNKIDDFLKEIRWPFMLLLLTLWSLSLLYLLHIAVVRLDVLRIRSHLRSPSSHRIASQSLLAAARVKALANVKYFSP
ncbi:Spectrin repeat superfamily Extracellular matrix-binding protein, putative [Babesia ovata]|uniref:Spectrin repeat superfamily Extracellular matrix-binding protein, putative n=1 Tax=Babesia ovata TaxID=189622 RepID=A0A2H6K904_9APIC|nr:Spectrin repeat superfamily Extracellular matrix-binding protein, putative [Babesia ovata]GBE59429.1 Spectrin repeat superfamily Extracellular matrix-binding protein, putative [Babesia ovata]